MLVCLAYFFFFFLWHLFTTEIKYVAIKRAVFCQFSFPFLLVFLIRVHIFWVGHKILQNLHLTFVPVKSKMEISKILWPSQNTFPLMFSTPKTCFLEMEWTLFSKAYISWNLQISKCKRRIFLLTYVQFIFDLRMPEW